MATGPSPGRFRLLGGLWLELPDDGPPGRAAQKKRLALLAYLAASYPDGVSREVLGTLLWPESDAERGRRRLSATLYELRQGLGPVVVEVAEALRYDPDVFPCDLIDHERALAAGDAATAVALYGGPFLDGVYLKGADAFERWATVRRDEYARRQAAALESLAETEEAAGNWVRAAEWWQRLGSLDPYNARLAARAMGAIAAAGDRAGAIRHGGQHTERLRADLEVEPEPEILALIEELRSAPCSTPAGLAEVPGGLAEVPGGLAEAPGGHTGTPTALVPEGPPAGATIPAGPPTRPLPGDSARSGQGPASSSRTWRSLVVPGVLALTLLLGAAIAVVRALPPTRPGGEGPPRLAVLPFENLGLPDDQYFADGITEELSARLVMATGVRVIGRTTTQQYSGQGADIRRIGEELDADYVLRGSVRWERLPDGTSRVRVTPELVRVADDVQRWAAVYDREATQLFAIQGLIARDVAAELGVRLGGTEIDAAANPPTTDLEAYDFFLQGNAHGARRVSESSARAAVALYERAVAIDPGFVEAWWRLVHGRVWLAWLVADEGQAIRARHDLDRLLEIGADRVEARLGLGWYHYYGERRYEDALRDFQWVDRQRPGDAEVLKTIGYLQRRLGRWDEAVSTMREALELSPRDHGLIYTLAQSLHWLGRFDQAGPHFERAILLAPDIPTYHGAAVDFHVARGDTIGAWGAVAWARDYGLDSWHSPRIHLFRRSYVEGADSIRGMPAAQPLTALRRYDALADAAARAGDHRGRALYADSLLQLARALGPENGREGGLEIRNTALLFAGLAQAHQGDAEGALRSVAHGLELESGYRDAIASGQARQVAARAFVRLGRTGEALDLIETLLATPSPLSRGELRLDPEWDPLRDHPRFQRLLGR